MNEPYQYVHRQESSNNTIGTIASHMAIGLGSAGAMEFAVAQGAKRARNESVRAYLNQMAYAEGATENKFIRAATSGLSTRPGRLFNYGGAAAAGLISGLLYSRFEK